MIKDLSPTAARGRGPRPADKPKGTLTKKELAYRWECTVRTVDRAVQTFGLLPCDVIGIQPVYRVGDVQRMEQRRKTILLKKKGLTLLPNGKVVKKAGAK